MMAPLLTPSPANPPGRISQILPTVKCSTCNQPVPLTDLGEHTCKAPPQAPSLPKPSITPAAATALLPQRLQGRVASPSPPPSAPLPPNPVQSTPPPSRASQQPQHQRVGAPIDRLRINTSSPGPGGYQSRSSPLGRSEPDALPSPIRARDPFAPTTGSPLRSQPPQGLNVRTRTLSNAGSISSVRSTPAPRPSISTNRDGSNNPNPPFRAPSGTGPPPINRGPSPAGGPPASASTPPVGAPPTRFPPGAPGGAFHPRGTSLADFGSPAPPVIPQPRQLSYVPPSERGIDTKAGGQAGMAGVGRRGFAAAARAAMLVGPPRSQLQNRHPNGPMYLDINASSSSVETPPLSAGSGYSSHSPGPLSPLPQAELVPEATSAKEPRTPSPSGRFITAPAPPHSPMSDKSQTPLAEPVPASPISSVRLPFFEKFKNILPGNATNTTDIPSFSNNESNIKNNSDNNSILTPKPGSIPRADSPSGRTVSSASFYGSPPTRAMSINTTSSRTRRPLSPSSDSESECGLAYADSTDDEEDTPVERRRTIKSPPAPLPLASSILRSGSSSSSSSSHVKFPSSSSTGDDRAGIKISRPGHKRDGSMSSISSIDSSTGLKRARTTSSAIAHALGLSQTPPSEYRKLGGPGVGLGRTVSSGSSASSGSRSAIVRGISFQSNAVLNGGALQKLMKDHVAEEKMPEVVQGADLVKSKSTSSKVSFGSSISGGSIKRMGMIDKKDKGKSREIEPAEFVEPAEPAPVVRKVGFADESTTIGEPSGSKSHRSNTVQGPHSSPEVRHPKLPARSRTTSSMDVKREKPRKERVCVKCTKRIEDGRWIQTDSGGVLCERCWKNMYLPKCRRCNLPIEKQAVSSSDGQLKGKYHKECFNCHNCHKPFPDKTFYVYDGKPLCAYHYHEANDSLCAAARCGQPIEGPCAVSHTGDRYHPEHMVCDGSDGEAEEEWVQSSKATKRITRFIDLAQVGAFAGAGAAATATAKKNEEEEESLL
ncbi:hypothetical protein BDQ17DRAFT_1342035 [Cyathus striatus]|nr:hypothetical protein BDQ17DRAFT_1342035 [Cyathus striatus]